MPFILNFSNFNSLWFMFSVFWNYWGIFIYEVNVNYYLFPKAQRVSQLAKKGEIKVSFIYTKHKKLYFEINVHILPFRLLGINKIEGLPDGIFTTLSNLQILWVACTLFLLPFLLLSVSLGLFLSFCKYI